MALAVIQVGRYDVYREPKEGTVSITLGPPENRMTLYVPAPRPNEAFNSALVLSVLEQIAANCGIAGACVKNEKIVERGKGGGRQDPNAICGLPTGKDVRNALMRAGYRNA
jgi:hypothetical protein